MPFMSRTALRALAVVPLCWLLAACWTSEHPLIDARHAARPPIAGVYHSADPEERDEGAIRVTATGDGGFLFDGEDDKQRVFLARLRGDWFILQWQMIDKSSGKAEEECLYSLLHATKGRLEVHGSPCDARLDGITGMKREGSTCTFGTLTALRRVALNALQRIEAGEPGEEPAVMVRE